MPFHRLLSAHLARNAIVHALIASLVLPAPLTALAANNAFSAVADVNTLDYVVNVDWDFDNPPTQVGNAEQVLNKAFITDIIRTSAKSVFTYTEGRHRIGNVYVYRNKTFGTNVDIQLINKDGRSNAHVSGWGKPKEYTSHNYLTLGQPETADMIGKVVAHELGHYTYGLADEYADSAVSSLPKLASFPQFGDTVKSSIMNDHLGFVSLSTPADYADPALRQTAQARVYGTGATRTGASAWETLVRNPAQDGPEAVSFQRTYFDAFKGLDLSNFQLKRPVEGFDAKLNIIFVSNPVFRDVIILDRTLATERFAELVQAAKAMLSQSKADTQYAIVVSPPLGADSAVLGYTSATTEGKQSLSQALDALQPVTTGVFDALKAFTDSFNLVAAARKTGDPVTFHLLTGADTSVPVESANTARTARIAVNPMGLVMQEKAQRTILFERAKAQSASGTAISLSQLAKTTGGVYNPAKNAAEASKDLIKAVKDTHAETYASLHTAESGPLAAGASFSSAFSVASAATDGEVTVEVVFGPSDASKLQFSLVSPGGTVYTPANLPAGISYSSDASEGVVEFVIGKAVSGRVGNWSVRAVASGPTKEGLFAEVSSDSATVLAASTEGGVVGANIGPVLRATLGAETRIRAASVTADIYREDGVLALSKVVMKDDGVSPDAIPGDGQYTANLSGLLSAGEYYAIITARTTADSRISSFSAQVKGALVPETPVDIMVRLAETSFELEANAPGVMVAAATPGTGTVVTADTGGGCTVNPNGRDASLLILLFSALLGWGLRRRALNRAK